MSQPPGKWTPCTEGGWIVNPDPPQPELTVFELRDGRYALAAETSEPFTADRPFTVIIDPVRLTGGLRR